MQVQNSSALTSFDFVDLDSIHPLVMEGYELVFRRAVVCRVVIDEVIDNSQLEIKVFKKQYYRIALSNPVDPFFFFSYQLTKDGFEQLAEEYGLEVHYGQVAALFESGEWRLEIDGRKALLKRQEVISHKLHDIFALVFEMEDQQFMDCYIEGQYQRVREEIRRIQARTADIIGLIRARNPYLLKDLQRH